MVDTQFSVQLRDRTRNIACERHSAHSFSNYRLQYDIPDGVGSLRARPVFGAEALLIAAIAAATRRRR